MRITTEIIAERDRQDYQWGGPAHDDRHSSFEFLTYVARQVDLGAAAKASTHRGRLLKIAALAMAGIEAIDRSAHAEQAAQLGPLSPAVNEAAIDAGLAVRVSPNVVRWHASTNEAWWTALARFAHILPQYVVARGASSVDVQP
ncbi:hypothetical protein D7S86_24540 [Pararobbsia silviterrae]|uniref:Uncharacterized protein n=2 Tax=Pararobbsia silviterrae TaxID=1792498 RepID=A0A494X8U7_9BURK|nr:hypothetical protein D7S86_24540 [Pararobbsia silviterrae]